MLAVEKRFYGMGLEGDFKRQWIAPSNFNWNIRRDPNGPNPLIGPNSHDPARMHEIALNYCNIAQFAVKR